MYKRGDPFLLIEEGVMAFGIIEVPAGTKDRLHGILLQSKERGFIPDEILDRYVMNLEVLTALLPMEGAMSLEKMYAAVLKRVQKQEKAKRK